MRAALEKASERNASGSQGARLAKETGTYPAAERTIVERILPESGRLKYGKYVSGTYEQYKNQAVRIEMEGDRPVRLLFSDDSEIEFFPIIDRRNENLLNMHSGTILREKWTTYEDAYTYARLGSRGELKIGGGRPHLDGSIPKKGNEKPWTQSIKRAGQIAKVFIEHGLVTSLEYEDGTVEKFPKILDKGRGEGEKYVSILPSAVSEREFALLDERFEIHGMPLGGPEAFLDLGGRYWMMFGPEKVGGAVDVTGIENPTGKKALITQAGGRSLNRIYAAKPDAPENSFEKGTLTDVYDKFISERLESSLSGPGVGDFILPDLKLSGEGELMLERPGTGRRYFLRFRNAKVQLKVIGGLNGEPRYLSFVSDEEGDPILDIYGNPLTLDLRQNVNHQLARLWVPYKKAYLALESNDRKAARHVAREIRSLVEDAPEVSEQIRMLEKTLLQLDPQNSAQIHLVAENGSERSFEKGAFVKDFQAWEGKFLVDYEGVQKNTFLVSGLELSGSSYLALNGFRRSLRFFPWAKAELKVVDGHAKYLRFVEDQAGNPILDTRGQPLIIDLDESAMDQIRGQWAKIVRLDLSSVRDLLNRARAAVDRNAFGEARRHLVNARLKLKRISYRDSEVLRLDRKRLQLLGESRWRAEGKLLSPLNRLREVARKSREIEVPGAREWEAARRGDEQALERIFKFHLGTVLGIAGSLAPEYGDLYQELVQEGSSELIVMIKEASSSEEDFTTRMRAALTEKMNRARTQYFEPQRQTRSLSQPLTPDGDFTLADVLADESFPDPLESMGSAYQSQKGVPRFEDERLQSFFEKLSPMEAEILWGIVNERDPQELAISLGVSVDEVEQVLERVLGREGDWSAGARLAAVEEFKKYFGAYTEGTLQFIAGTKDIDNIESYAFQGADEERTLTLSDMDRHVLVMGRLGKMERFVFYARQKANRRRHDREKESKILNKAAAYGLGPAAIFFSGPDGQMLVMRSMEGKPIKWDAALDMDLADKIMYALGRLHALGISHKDLVGQSNEESFIRRDHVYLKEGGSIGFIDYALSEILQEAPAYEAIPGTILWAEVQQVVDALQSEMNPLRNFVKDFKIEERTARFYKEGFLSIRPAMQPVYGARLATKRGESAAISGGLAKSTGTLPMGWLTSSDIAEPDLNFLARIVNSQGARFASISSFNFMFAKGATAAVVPLGVHHAGIDVPGARLTVIDLAERVERLKEERLTEKIEDVAPTEGRFESEEYAELAVSGRAILRRVGTAPTALIRYINREAEAASIEALRENRETLFGAGAYFRIYDVASGELIAGLSDVLPKGVDESKGVLLGDSTQRRLLKVGQRFVSTQHLDSQGGKAEFLPLAAAFVAGLIVGRLDTIGTNGPAQQFFSRLTQVDFGEEEYKMFVNPSAFAAKDKEYDRISIKSISRVVIDKIFQYSRMALQLASAA